MAQAGRRLPVNNLVRSGIKMGQGHNNTMLYMMWLDNPAGGSFECGANCRVRKDHWKGMSALEKEAIAQQQLQQVADKKARQQMQLQEDWLYARDQVDIARSMASQANQVCN